ncbi:MAG: von Willebrand factor type A domain-containing protein [Pseudomonadales bacterium]|jgi:Ca-activated chloride channel family protein|nr:von Willebrand factor type A domain-containing protein [Pseudomonadales bacterium]
MSHALRTRTVLLVAVVSLIAACARDPEPQRPVEPGPGVGGAPPDTTLGRPHADAEVEEFVVATGKLSEARPVSGQLLYQRSVPGLPPGMPPATVPVDREGYEAFEDHGVLRVGEHPVSTFSIDVDSASYANVRRFLNQGQLPRGDAVRTEELVNYFDYGYPEPEGDAPFAVYTEVGPSPWHPERKLLHLGLQTERRAPEDVPASNLVFLVDVSGSMQAPDKLELLKASLKLLAARLRPQDRVAIAVYAGAAGIVLEPTAGDRKAEIVAALDQLRAGGSTHGSAGIQLAYALARQSFVEGGVNRVILATDGDFNVGTVNHEALEELVEREREAGVALTVLGFGTGNYQDGLMQRLAQIGDGNAAYIDTLSEARKVLVEELAATLEIVARDVKIQVEFNPARVAEYRLIGYETRALEREDFANDAVDAGEIGPGHTVTALYELALVGEGGALHEPLRYGDEAAARTRAGLDAELAHLRLRYKRPGAEESTLSTHPILAADVRARLADTSDAYRFAAAAAAFGQLLRGGDYTGAFAWDDVAALARDARGADPWGHRGEFLGLVGTAKALTPARVGSL